MGASASITEQRLSWIFGSSRSGSTWLLRMLCELDGVAGIDDPHLGHHLGVWRPISLAWAASRERPRLRQLSEVKGEKDGYFFNERYADTWRPLLAELIAGRFRAQADDEGARSIVVKEPGSQAAGLLRSLFPASFLVFLLRDGRDVVDSWLDAYQHGAWAQHEGAFPLAEGGRVAFVRWQASVWAYRTEAVAQAYAAHDPGRRIMVRYEDLLAKPVAELGRIAEALKLDADPSAISAAAARCDIARVSHARKGAGREIRDACPGGWRERLTPEEADAMHAEIGPTLERFGYHEAPVEARLAGAHV